MTESSVTETGTADMRAAIDQFPDRVTAALKAVAGATAGRVQSRAQDILRSKLKTSVTALIEDITVEEDAANKQFLIVSRSPVGQGTNVNLWNEYGTVKMAARPYMHPAAKAEEARYQAEMQAAADGVARDTFGE